MFLTATIPFYLGKKEVTFHYSQYRYLYDLISITPDLKI